MKCEECGEATQFIRCAVNPKASEWYCDKCHRSYTPSMNDMKHFASDLHARLLAAELTFGDTSGA